MIDGALVSQPASWSQVRAEVARARPAVVRELRRREWHRADVGRRRCRRRLGQVGRHLDGHVRGEPQRTVDDDTIARREALRNEPALGVPIADDDRPQLGPLVLVDDPDEVSLRALLHGPLRNEDRVRPDRAGEPRAHVLVGAQHALGIVDRRTDQEGSRLRIVGGVRERDLAFGGEHRAVDELDLHDELVGLRQPDLPLLYLAADALHLVFGDAEVDPHGRQHRDGGELAVLRIDVGAVGHCREAGNAVDGRRDDRVREVELRRLELRLRLRDGRGRLFVLPLRIVEVLLRQRVLLRERLGAREVRLGDFHRCLIALQRGRRGVDLRLEWFLVHPEQHLARLDDGALGVHALVEESRYPRRDVDRLRALRLRDEDRRDGHVARHDRQHRHVDRRARRVLLVVLAAPGDE